MLPPVQLAAATMREVGVRWAVAGGWAIDLWWGEQTRVHHDVEVVVRRDDQLRVHSALAPAWELRCLDPPGEAWRPWGGHPLHLPAFQLQARSSAFELDVFTETVEDVDDVPTWHFRRDPRIARPWSEVVTAAADGTPIVRPEVQLLYMAKSDEPKNQHDFDLALPRLDREAVEWLAAALALTIPGHPWLQRLERADPFS